MTGKDETLIDRALRWERETPERVFMTQPLGGGRVRDYTWAEAVGEARRMAAHLQTYGFPPGSRIAILSKNCAQFVLSDLAIWMAGHVSVALYPTVDAETVRYVLEHSESRLLFVGKLDTWDRMRPGVPEAIPRIRYGLAPPSDDPTWEDLVEKVEPLPGTPARRLDDLALLMYTSGSTGRPKGVEHTFRSMIEAARGLDRVMGWRPDDRGLSYLPLAHVFERAAVECCGLHSGLHMFFAESLDTFLEDVKRARPTVFQSVPRLWLKFQLGVFEKVPEDRLRLLLRIPLLSRLVKRKILRQLGLDRARLGVTGAAAAPPALLRWYRDLGLEVLEGYAMTENFCYSHLSEHGKSRLGYVGAPLPGVECKIGPGGEVLVKSPATMRGYHKEPDLTVEAFTADGFLRTGDCGEIDEQGRLRITGRLKELFKTSKGKYVAPTPIENLLNADRSIEQSCVAGVGLPQPFALVVLSEGLRARLGGGGRAAVETALARLREQVNAKVQDCERLQFLAVVKEPWLVENGLLTPTLKIRRQPIEARYGSQVKGWYDAGRPVVWES